MLRVLLALVLLALLALLAGCGHAMCDPRPVSAPWRRYEPMLPVNTVVCGQNRVSEKKPSNGRDDWPPTQLFVFFRDDPVPVAFEKTVRRFESAGWTSDRRVLEPGNDGLYSAVVTRSEVSIDITVNKNDWGVQGSFKLQVREP